VSKVAPILERLAAVLEQAERSVDRPVLDELVTIEALADELGKNRRTLDRWHKLGRGPPRTLLGREIYYRRDAVRQWLAEQEQRSGVVNYTGKRRGRRPHTN
jgi:hypothetical protein